MSEHDQLEEERRLWYVAMTRAKKHLHITHARERYSFGTYTANPESRFLTEIPDEYKENKSDLNYGTVSQLFGNTFGKSFGT